MAQALAVVVGLTAGGGPRVAWSAPVQEGSVETTESESESESESEPADGSEPTRESEGKSTAADASDGEPGAEPGAQPGAEPGAAPEAEPGSEPGSESGSESGPSEAGPESAQPEPTTAETETKPKPKPKPKPKAPAPTVGIPTIAVGVGLSPEAPGSKKELALLAALEQSVTTSASPTTKVRRLSIGSGTGRRVCRQRRDDLVILVGYVPGRERPVLLAHDCRLDTPLSVRGEAAASEPGLVGALWDEREELVRGGMRERRTISKLSPRVRGGIIAGAAIAVVGTAIGLLVANALRKERVVVTVSP